VTDLADALRKEIEEKSTEAMERAICDGKYVVSPEVLKADSTGKPEALPSVGKYNAIKATLGGQIGTLRAKLSQLIKAKTACRREADQESGELDSSNLHSLRAGNKFVFAQKREGDKIDTAITLLIDLSGSMSSSENSGTGAHAAQRTAIAVAETLESLGIKFEILGFHNLVGVREGCTGRSWALRIEEFKTFDEKLAKARDGLASAMDGGGNNSDGDALIAAAKRIAKRPEARKMILVLSDGRPAAGCNLELEAQHLVDMIRKVVAAGIEVLGIGLGNNGSSVREYYTKENGSDHIWIREMDKIAESVLKLLKDKLVGGKRRVA